MCFHPLCDQPAEDCEVDHKTAFTDGGDTTQANGQPACGFHNRWKQKNPDPRHTKSSDGDGDEDLPAA